MNSIPLICYETLKGLNCEWILFDILMALLQLFIAFPFIKALNNFSINMYGS